MPEQIKQKILELIDTYGKNIPRAPDYDVCVVLRDLLFFIRELEGETIELNEYLTFLDKYKECAK